MIEQPIHGDYYVYLFLFIDIRRGRLERIRMTATLVRLFGNNIQKLDDHVNIMPWERLLNRTHTYQSGATRNCSHDRKEVGTHASSRIRGLFLLQANHGPKFWMENRGQRLLTSQD